MKKACLLVLTLILIPCVSYAKTETIFANNKYIMGDNDSKNDARRMCFLGAKRKVLEKAGTYIESQTQVKDFRLTKDEINSYSAALLKVETVKEEWKLAGESMAVFMTVKAQVDTDYIEKQLANIKKDTTVQNKIKDQQARLQDLEKTVVNLQKQLGSVDATKAAVLRKERNVTFKKIDTLEAKKIAIVKKVRRKSKKAKDLIERGMTKADVRSLLGAPDGIDVYCPASGDCWCYGHTSISFNGAGIVIHVQ
jgi:hypothetical protein